MSRTSFKEPRLSRVPGLISASHAAIPEAAATVKAKAITSATAPKSGTFPIAEVVEADPGLSGTSPLTALPYIIRFTPNPDKMAGWRDSRFCYVIPSCACNLAGVHRARCRRSSQPRGVASGKLVDLSAKCRLPWILHLADMPTTWRLSHGSAWRYEVRRAL